MKKILLTGVSAIVLAWSVPAVANDGFFQWLEGNLNSTNSKTTFGITGFKALSETNSNLVYSQFGLSRQDSKNTFNLGAGVRNLTSLAGTPAIVGFNVFFDTKDGSKKFWSLRPKEAHQRLSFGLELKTATLDMSANYYSPISKDIIADEKVLKGWDATVKGQVPGNDQIFVGLNIYKFTGTSGNYDQGNKAFVEFKPSNQLSLRAEYDKPKGEKAKTNVYANFKFIINNNLATSPETADVWTKRYDKVERRYDVLTEKVVTASIAGAPSSLTAQWGSAITPTYNLPTEVVSGKVRESFVTADYTFAVSSATSGIFTAEGNNHADNFDASTGGIKASRTVKAGTITVTVTRKAKGLLKQQTKNVTLTVSRKAQPFDVATAYDTEAGSNALNGASGARIPFDINDDSLATVATAAAGDGTVTVSDLVTSGLSGTAARYDTDFEVFDAASSGTKYTDWNAVKTAIAGGNTVYFEDDSSSSANIINFTVTIAAGDDALYNATDAVNVFFKSNAATD